MLDDINNKGSKDLRNISKKTNKVYSKQKIEEKKNMLEKSHVQIKNKNFRVLKER